MAGNNLLIVKENNRDFNGMIEFLNSNGFKTSIASNDKEFIEKTTKSSPDLILMSIDGNSFDTIKLCQLLKSNKNTEAIFIVLLSTRKEEEIQIKGLEAGADDFVFQPITQRVLLSRLKALLKRRKWKGVDDESEELFIDEERFLIIRKGQEIYLPKKEFQILSLLYSKPNKVFTREEIKNSLWENFEQVRGRTIDVHIRKIREKIGEDIVATVKGIGYRLELI